MPTLTVQNGTTFPWAEISGKGVMTFPDGSWKTNAQRQTMAMLINDSDLEGALAFLLGYAAVGVDKITRRVPWAHPRFPWMRVAEVASIKGMKALNRDGFGGVKYANHKYQLLTLVFASPGYEVKEDAMVSAENQRYVRKRSKTVTQAMTLDKGEWKFVGKPTMFKAGPQIMVPRKMLQWTWFSTPVGWAVDAEGNAPKIEALAGKVNDAPFGGYNAGELLMKDPDIVEMEFAAKPGDVGLPGGSVSRGYDVTINMEALVVPSTHPSERGHNLAPIPGTNDWWPICPVSDSSARRYLAGTFTNIWTKI